mmetsp:Transcript_39414/g.82570  ORF Transcript_39414/g.82570 Transcript_39414/m.82570 type:complete len:80 (+) Transcript_39414:926-1165(+)
MPSFMFPPSMSLLLLVIVLASTSKTFIQCWDGFFSGFGLKEVITTTILTVVKELFFHEAPAGSKQRQHEELARTKNQNL